MSETVQDVLLVTPPASGTALADVPAVFEPRWMRASFESAEQVLKEQKVSIIVVDVRSSAEPDVSWIKQLRGAAAGVPILAMIPHGAVRLAVEAMRCGASDVVDTAPADTVLERIISARNQHSTRMCSRTLNGGSVALPNFGRLFGESPVMRSLFSQVESVAPRDTTVLITGESGTGKELVAREIHERSSRRAGPLVAINCAAIPDTLIESELFGHERGAFTSAVNRHIGHAESAHGGTLFLDEVGELSLAAQGKLLRFLQEREVHRVGSARPIRVDTRIVAASHRDLDELVRAGRFRQDLLYRINVVNLVMPPLRSRGTDLEILIESCLGKLSTRYAGRNLSITNEALQVMRCYPWPGNIRELENVLESLLALHPDAEVCAHDLPPHIRGTRSMATPSGMTIEIETDGLAFGDVERVFETEMIVRALEKANYVQSRAATMLGISRRILKYKMDKLGIAQTRG